jgi:hypothetical protein
MSVNVRLLGSFEVAMDGVPVPPEAWSRRQAASLVKLLALARAEHREGDRALLTSQAAQRFTAAGHARDSARCAALSARLPLASAES